MTALSCRRLKVIDSLPVRAATGTETRAPSAWSPMKSMPLLLADSSTSAGMSSDQLSACSVSKSSSALTRSEPVPACPAPSKSASAPLIWAAASEMAENWLPASSAFHSALKAPAERGVGAGTLILPIASSASCAALNASRISFSFSLIEFVAL